MASSGADLERDDARDLERAIGEGGLFLGYQPIIAFTSSSHRVEAVPGWRDERRGPRAPHEIAEAAQAGGLGHVLGEWLLITALRETRSWRREGDAIDLSLLVPTALGAELTRTLESVLEFAGAAPGCLTIQISERTVSDDPGRAAVAFREIRDLGVRVAIDDFGTHWGSIALLRGQKRGALSLLRELVVDEVRLAARLVRSLTTSYDDAAQATAIIGAAWSLGIDVIATCVDDPDTLTMVRMLGCERAQGAAVAPPMGPLETLAWLRHREAAAAR